MFKVNNKDGWFTIPLNIYNEKFLQIYQLVALIRKLIS